MQDYKFVYRNVWDAETVYAGNGVVYVQNVLEFQDYLNEMYLQTGYKIDSVNYLGEVAVDGKNKNAMRYVYHLVKEVNAK